MLIGDPSNFAIEFDVVDVYDNFAYCSFYFWVDGKKIGNSAEEAVLGVIIHSSKVFLRYEGKRKLAAADDMADSQLWNYLESHIYSDEPVEYAIALEGQYRIRFLLHDIADDSIGTVCKIMLVEQSDGFQRLLWKCNGSNLLRAIRLKPLVVDSVIKSFIEAAENLP